MPTKRGRQLDDALRSLGSDQTEAQPAVGAELLNLVSLVDDLSFSIAPRSHIKVWTHIIPSTLAAQFSGFDLVPSRGMWVRKIFVVAGTGNCLVNVLPAAGFAAMTANDALASYTLLVSQPEPSEFAQATTSIAQVTRPAAAGYPELFAAAQVGRFAAAQAGIFVPAGEVPLEDFWIPPMACLEVTAVTAAAAISVQLQLEFPAEYVFTGQS